MELTRMSKSETGRLLIDHSHTTLSGYQTGVQRVVRNICQHAMDCESEFREVVPVRWSQGAFQNAPLGGQVLSKGAAQKAIKSNLLQSIANLFRRNRTVVAQSASLELPLNTVQFTKGDILLLPDAYWAFPMVWPTVSSLRNDGIQTAVVIYDLIPHTHAGIYGEQGAEGFRNYVRLAYQHADCLLAISETVREQLYEHLPDIIGINEVSVPIRSFKLGADFQDKTGPVRSELRSVFEGSEHHMPYVMIGTIEARKNHTFAMDAMEELWKQYPDRRLCIVGQPGWKGEAVVERITDHHRYQKQLFWFQNASDAEVLFCYRNAKGVIFPSLTEGFGLPIVEALWHQRETFASDIRIHREAGKNLCHYFSLDNSSNLASQLLSKEGQSVQTNSTSPADLVVPWSVAVPDLLNIVHECLGRTKRSDRLVSRSAA